MDTTLQMDHGITHRQCTATSKQTKQRCKRQPIPGGTVCVMHGGGAPLVKLKAAERLALLLDPHLPVVAQRIVQGMYAMKTELFQKDGIVTDKRNLVNFSERRESAKLAMQALGIVPEKSSGPTGDITINVVYVSPGQLSEGEPQVRIVQTLPDEVK